jgi:hypothetical protein
MKRATQINELDRLVIQTIAYSSCFNFALRKGEVVARLPYLKKIIYSPKKITESLQKLVNQSIIKNHADYYYLENADLLNRQRRQKYVLGKQAELDNFTTLVRKIPFIKAVVLTGSTAVDNAKKNDDLDFLLICQHNTLWLSRLLLIILTKLKGKRPLGQASNAWCFNLWLDEADLTLEHKRRSLYEAYEVLQMKFIYDAGEVEEAFYNANSWLKEQLFCYHSRRFGQYETRKNFSLLNYILFAFQKTYRQLIFGQENFSLSPTQAFFNELSYREQIFTKLKKKMEQILLHANSSFVHFDVF